MFFEGLEILFNELQSENIGVLMLHKFEFHLVPLVLHNEDGLAHLELLLGSVGDVFDLVFEVEKLQVPDGLDGQRTVDFELGLDQRLDLVPMSAVFDDHGGVFKFVE